MKWYWKATFRNSFGNLFDKYSCGGFSSIEAATRDLSQCIKAGLFDSENDTPTLCKVELTTTDRTFVK